MLNVLNSDKNIEYVNTDVEDSKLVSSNDSNTFAILGFKLCGNSLFLKYRETYAVTYGIYFSVNSLPTHPGVYVFRDQDECYNVPQNPPLIELERNVEPPVYDMATPDSIDIYNPQHEESEEKPKEEKPEGGKRRTRKRKHFSKKCHKTLKRKGKKTMKRKSKKTLRKK